MRSCPRIAGIVLAAGKSTRMGCLKQLLPLRGSTILQCVVNAALESTLDQVVVVLGHQARLIRPLLLNSQVTVSLNRHFERGQSSSLKCGLRALADDVDAALFLLGDQPLIRSATIDLILSTYRNSPAPIVMPVYNGQRGNPVLFSRETFPDIAALENDCGARSLFDENSDSILRVAVSDPAIRFDVDTDQDYRDLLRIVE
jgi:molybdenum cofactor cytidylyltransferase